MHRPLVFFIVLSLGGALLQANPDAVGPPPPLPQPVKARVFQGEEATIVLVAQGREAGSAKFLIRSRPQYGVLSEIRPVGPGRAAVVYRHFGKGEATSDAFTYAVQAPDSPVSASVRVELQIAERPPVFSGPKSVEFGEAILGQAVAREISLQNLGGGILQGKASADSPWEIVGSADYEIPEKESRSLVVEFRPEKENSYQGVIRFSHDPKAIVLLEGAVRSPLAFHPYRLDLHQKSAAEPGFLQVTNQTEEDLLLLLKSDPGILVPEMVEIAAGESEVLKVRVEKGHTTGAEGVLRLQYAFGSEDVAFRVFPAPAKISMNPEKEMDFGVLLPGREKVLPLRISNTGGIPLDLQLGADAPAFLPDGYQLALAPGQTREISVGLNARRPGQIQSVLTLRGAQGKSSILLSGQVDSVGKGETSSRLQVTELTAGQLQEDGCQIPEGTLIFRGTSFDQIRLTARTETSVQFEWDPPSPSPAGYRVEQRVVRNDPAGAPLIAWLPVTNVEVHPARKGPVQAIIFALQPGTRLVVRIISLDASGTPIGASGNFPVSSLAPQPASPGIPMWPLFILLLSLLGWGAWRWIHWQQEKQRKVDLLRVRELEQNR